MRTAVQAVRRQCQRCVSVSVATLTVPLRGSASPQPVPSVEAHLWLEQASLNHKEERLPPFCFPEMLGHAKPPRSGRCYQPRAPATSRCRVTPSGCSSGEILRSRSRHGVKPTNATQQPPTTAAQDAGMDGARNPKPWMHSRGGAADACGTA